MQRMMEAPTVPFQEVKYSNQDKHKRQQKSIFKSLEDCIFKNIKPSTNNAAIPTD